jgi:hypothetical protein
MYASSRRGNVGFRLGTKIAVMIAQAMNVTAAMTNTVFPRAVIPDSSIARTLPRSRHRNGGHEMGKPE